MARLVMLRSCKMLMILIPFIACSGCATHYVPQPYPVKPEMVPRFTASQAVSIINARTQEKFKARVGEDTYIKGDFREWTDAAVEVLKTELRKNDIAVSEGASKVLKFAITKVYMFWGRWSVRCVLYLKVETGDGYAKEFEGNNSSPEGFRGASPLAVTKAVVAMLNDDRILGYLKKEDQ